MKSKIIIAITLVLALSTLAIASPALAQNKRATSTAARITNLQNRGNQEIDKRITSLNNLLSRIQEMKKVSDTQKASFSTTIQNEISNLTSLKAKVASDTSTTSAKADVQSITKAYRVYMLTVPQLRISAASDRIGTIADMLTTISGKLQTRLSQDTNISNLSALQADLADLNAKIVDAKTQAQNAVSETASLQPDNGDKTIAQSNTTALKDAKSKIQAAKADFVAARKDVETIVNAIKASKTSATTSTQ
jgi:hypothetical protein